MNRLLATVAKPKKLLSIYTVAGISPTIETLVALEKSGVDFVELGFPFSDPIADGSIIQEASTLALKNGMSIKKLFSELKNVRTHVSIPLILMGYLNPMLQYGVERFLDDAAACGIDGLIIPDLPVSEIEKKYAKEFAARSILFNALVTPQTFQLKNSADRLRKLASVSTGFLYAVSSNAITGTKGSEQKEKEQYLTTLTKTLKELKLPRTPELMVGFGISTKEDLSFAQQYAKGGIIGSAFVKSLMQDTTGSIQKSVEHFIEQFHC